MKIALVSLISPVHNEEKINSSLEEISEKIKNSFVVEEVSSDSIDENTFENYDFVLVFVKSGGTENIFLDFYQFLPRPIYLLSTELHNSLPAAMEILSFIKKQGENGKILHGEPENIIDEIKKLAEYKKIRDQIAASKMGVIGCPSDWLIASEINYEHASHHWGTDFIDIDLHEVELLYNDVDDLEAKKTANKFINKSEKMVENSRNDVFSAAKLYLVLKKIVDKYQLDALTLRCFDLVEKLNTTGCLALSELNNEDITAGCEGDIPALFTMYFSKIITGNIPFMANPVKVDKNNDEVIFAHCTAATDMTEKYILRSHFETGMGVGIQGIIKEGPATVLKIGGEGLEQYFIAEGKITENLNSPDACRTQIKLHLPGSADYLLADPIGNHHIIILGHHADKIEEFLGLE
ncbi:MULTISPECIES: fucose isomerase [unclassified Halanaerobium]|uniref:fucose isomerase n=1 Tax=unclassified Halanaerobium TaxID=2641197 RepID=UPI000DF29FB8|nr:MULTISPECIES: fucose isomerase [unclassified Halanaerobium]RCW49857.1 L-fucose isomerase-like protein [Halanaerobium sp. MA284_MarDTE_T2]RCW88501.1 L-fucose isomerase-like protein [Halanaerobium sp. DL-01]